MSMTTKFLDSPSFSIEEVITLNKSGDPFELDNDGEIVKPEMLISDWIEMIMLSTLLLIGLPLNAVALTRLLHTWNFGKTSLRTKQEQTRTSFLWLKIHLTVIDLIVITCYCPSHIAWLISYTWRGTEFMCRAMQYSWDFCFHLMSFGVVGIAIDRLKTVYNLMAMEKLNRMTYLNSNPLIFVRKLIISCYVGAAVVSIPQWFVWTTIDMRTWSQCTTIWHKSRALQYLQNHDFEESFYGEQIYTLVHLITVFWAPFLVLFIAYFYIVLHLFYYSISAGNIIRSNINNDDESLWQNQPIFTSADNNSTLSKTASDRLNLTKLRQYVLRRIVENAATEKNIFYAVCLQNILKHPRLIIDIIYIDKMVPAWRREMRSRMFCATVNVIAAYLICWMPYNVLSLATFFSSKLQIIISTHLELLRVCVLLNTLLNPFIYGFKNAHQT